jgi:DNA repair photolyase
MRWDNLTRDGEVARLPGYRDEAVVRTFDAPEALDVRFYEVRARSVLNRVPERSTMPFRWTVNPYRGCTHACVYCFARSTHRYLDFDAGRDFEREIVVKVNAPEVLARELGRPSWAGEHVALGTNTDPYQWVEARYRLMPGIWRALGEHATPCSVLTKSPLVLRDLDLLRELAAEGLFSAALSVPTLDERAWRATEPHTPHPAARLEAIAKLTRAGIPTSVLIAPLMPGINDSPGAVREIVARARAAGARSVTPIALHLRAGVRDVFVEWLERERPDLLARYGELYGGGAYAPPEERRRLAELVHPVSGRHTAPRFARRDPAPVRAPRARETLQAGRQEPLF